MTKYDIIDIVSVGIAMSAGSNLSTSVTRTSDFEDHMTLVVQDIYEWIKLVFAIHHPLFHLPHCITYGKYRFILDEMANVTVSQELLMLDPKKQLPDLEVVEEMNTVDPMYRHLLSNYMVLIVDNTADEIIQLDVVSPSETTCTWTDEYRILGLEGGPHKTIIRTVRFKAVHQYDHRHMLLRWKATESTLMSRTMCLMLSDPSMPLRIIPGISNVQSLEAYARNVDLED